MNAHAMDAYAGVEGSLADVLGRLQGNDDMPLLIEYAGRTVQSGHHITEVKAASFTTLDCGGNPDAWQETVLQVEDLPATDGREMMTAGKFRKILSQVDGKVRLNHDARLTIEIGRPGEAMRVFDIAGVAIDSGQARLKLGVRAAICKPRHRAQQAEAASCCSPSTKATACC